MANNNTVIGNYKLLVYRKESTASLLEREIMAYVCSMYSRILSRVHYYNLDIVFFFLSHLAYACMQHFVSNWHDTYIHRRTYTKIINAVRII